MKKKLYIIFAIFTILSYSCVKTTLIEENKGELISFMANVDVPILRSSNVITTSTITSIGVDSYNTRTESPIPFFVSNLVKKGNVWTPSSPQYYPLDNTLLSFHLYSPADISKSHWTRNYYGFENFVPQIKMNDQVDVMYSYVKGQYSTNKSTPIPVTLRHILSQIDIQAKSSHPSIQVKLRGVKIAYPKSKGSFQANWYDDFGSWKTIANDKATYVDTRTADITLTSSYQSILSSDNRFMLLPQTLDPWNTGNKSNSGQQAYLALLVQISDNGFQIYPNDSNKYGYIAVPLTSTNGNKWTEGKKYTYKISFFGTDGRGGFGYQDPNPNNTPSESSGGPNSNIVDKETGIPNGNSIKEEVDIKYNVNVDNFTETTIEIIL